MSWIVLTDNDNNPVLFNVEDISCILVSSDIPNGSANWFKNQENEKFDVKESLAEIYTQISKPHNNFELLDRYNRNETIMQEVPKTKPKITRWEKFWKTWLKEVPSGDYNDIMCKMLSCSECPALGHTSCIDKQQFKAYMLEEVEDDESD